MIDTIILKLQELVKTGISKIKIPNFLDFFLNKKTADESVKDSPDPKTNWEWLGLSKTWWAFLPILGIIAYVFFKFGLDAIYRVIMFVLDSGLSFVYIITGIILLKMLNLWNPIMDALIKLINKFRSDEKSS